MKLIFILLCCLTTQAASIYVAKTGNDSNPGTIGSPKLTIQAGYNIANAGDTVVVGAGIYAESPRFDRPGTSANRITIDGQGVATIRGWSFETIYTKVVGFNITTDATTFNPRVYVSQGGHFNIMTNNTFDMNMTLTGFPIIQWNGAASYPFGTAGSSNFFCYNTFKNIRDEMVFRINGNQNTIGWNVITNTDNTDQFQLAGGTNYVIGNVMLSLVQLGVYTNNHADIVQMFGNAGGSSQSSWGHYFVSNYVYTGSANVNSELQVGNLTDDGLSDVGKLHVWNNIFIGVAAKCSVAQPETEFINNLFVTCATNSNNGGATLIFSDLPGVGRGNKGKLYNCIFDTCGINGLTNNGNGGYHFDTTLTGCEADYNVVTKKIGGVWKPIEQDSNTNHYVTNGGTWDAFLWYEPHGKNGVDPSFVNEAQFDFRLLASSILRGAGLNQSALFSTDFRGVSRSAWDIGPFEFQQSDFNTYPCDVSNRLVSAYSVISSNATTIYWPANLFRTEFTINRRTDTNRPSAWPVFTNIFTLTSASVTNSGSFTDTNNAGIAYEYQIGSRIPTNTLCGDANGYREYEYLFTGYKVPLKDTRGSVSLWMESGVTNALWAEWTTLQSDLRGAGYKVYPHYAAATEVTAGTTWTNAVWSVKQTITSDYNIDTNAPFYILLVGHIPVPYSGDQSPGGHTDNKGAHSGDLFYADLNGIFTDTTVNDISADFPFTHNIPGDGKFDQDTIPSAPEARIGRIDFRNLPAYSQTEVQLLSRYLTRNHNWRQKNFTVRQKALIYNGESTPTTTVSGKPMESHGLFSGYFGTTTTSVDLGDWLSLGGSTNTTYLFAHEQGSGHTNASLQLGTTTDFANTNLYVPFTATYGSYFGSWDSGVQTNAFLPGVLANGGYPLATWYHENYMPVGSSAMDEPIGYEQFAMQSSSLLAGTGKEYIWYYRDFQGTSFLPVTGPHKMWESLMGDPTLLTHQIYPVSSLAVNASGSDNVLTWTASIDSGIVGYHIYRTLTSDQNNFTRLTSNVNSSTTFTDTGGASGNYTYMVRAIKLDEDNPARSYYGASQGVFVASSGSGPVLQPGQVITGNINVKGSITYK